MYRQAQPAAITAHFKRRWRPQWRLVAGGPFQRVRGHEKHERKERDKNQAKSSQTRTREEMRICSWIQTSCCNALARRVHSRVHTGSRATESALRLKKGTMQASPSSASLSQGVVDLCNRGNTAWKDRTAPQTMPSIVCGSKTFPGIASHSPPASIPPSRPPTTVSREARPRFRRNLTFGPAFSVVQLTTGATSYVVTPTN